MVAQMSYYKKITIWENRGRARLLTYFMGLIATYFNNVECLDYGLEVREKEEAQRARTRINMTLDRVYSVIISTGIKPTIRYSPPAAVGGLVRNIDLMHNIFQLSRFQIGPQTLLDFIERTIGIYDNDRRNAFCRTINPFFWIGLVLNYVVSLPFKLIGKIGFDQQKIESSTAGRVIKGVFYLIVVFAAFLSILEKIGYLDKFMAVIQAWPRR